MKESTLPKHLALLTPAAGRQPSGSGGRTAAIDAPPAPSRSPYLNLLPTLKAPRPKPPQNRRMSLGGRKLILQQGRAAAAAGEHCDPPAPSRRACRAVRACPHDKLCRPRDACRLACRLEFQPTVQCTPPHHLPSRAGHSRVGLRRGGLVLAPHLDLQGPSHRMGAGCPQIHRLASNPFTASPPPQPQHSRRKHGGCRPM